MMTEKLKCCPFCGGKGFVNTVEHSVENRPNGYRFHGEIMCGKCQASAGTTGFDLTYEEATDKAIIAWNTRVADEEIEQLKRDLATQIEHGERLAERLQATSNLLEKTRQGRK